MQSATPALKKPRPSGGESQHSEASYRGPGSTDSQPRQKSLQSAQQTFSLSSQERNVSFETPNGKAASAAQAPASEASESYQYSPTKEPGYRLSPSRPDDQDDQANISMSPLRSYQKDLNQNLPYEPIQYNAPLGNESNSGPRRTPTGQRELFQEELGIKIADSPGERGTDPELWRRNVPAAQFIMGIGDGRDDSDLRPSYKHRKHDFFRFGRVFKMLWAEPAGSTISSNAGIVQGLYGQMIYTKIRRFVVIRAAHNYCSTLAISSYGGQGVAKPGVKKSEHGIIYTGKSPPEETSAEKASHGEGGMRIDAIRVIIADPTDALDPMSRIDYGKVYTVQHNVKVSNVGKVHRSSESALVAQFWNVWAADGTNPESSTRPQRTSHAVAPSTSMQTVNPGNNQRPGARNVVNGIAALYFQKKYRAMLQDDIPDHSAFQACVKEIMDANLDLSKLDAEAYIRDCLTFKGST